MTRLKAIPRSRGANHFNSAPILTSWPFSAYLSEDARSHQSVISKRSPFDRIPVDCKRCSGRLPWLGAAFLEKLHWRLELLLDIQPACHLMASWSSDRLRALSTL